MGLLMVEPNEKKKEKKKTSKKHNVDQYDSHMNKNKNKTVHNYPIIELKISSKSLVQTIAKLLYAIDISYFTSNKIVHDPRFKKPTKQFSITISGKSNLSKWFELIGSRNPSYLSRYAVYRKYGFCPPYTNYLERRDMLIDKLDPHSYY